MHTYKEASPEGSWGLLNIQLGNVISWSETPDIHIVQFSVCVCSDLVSDGYVLYDVTEEDDQYVRRPSLS